MIKIINHGNNNNIHLKFILGSKKNPTAKINLVAFPDTGLAYIVRTTSIVDVKIIDKNYVFDKINNDLNKLDFKLKLRSDNDLLLKKINTQELLAQINESFVV